MALSPLRVFDWVMKRVQEMGILARNVHFISGLMESGVEFVAVDKALDGQAC